MGNRVVIALVSAALVLPSLGNGVAAEEPIFSVDEQVQPQAEENTEAQDSIIFPDESPVQGKETTESEETSDLVVEEKLIVNEEKEEIKENNDSDVLKQDRTIELQSENQTPDAPEQQSLESVNEITPNKSETVNEAVVVRGNTTYHLNNLGFIDYSEEYSNGILVKIQEYYPNTKLEDVERNRKYVFHLNGKENLLSATKLEKGTQKVLNQYEYYPETVYGQNHGKNIIYKFHFNGNEHLTKASKHEKGTQDIQSWYEYYPQTVYGQNHGRNIQYKFDINQNGYLTKASKRENKSQHFLTWYEYYPQTVYGQNHGKNIQYRFDINSNGYLTKAAKKENRTQRTLSWYEYYPQTTYGKNHGKNLMYRFDLQSNGELLKASKRERGTQRILSWYEYYPQTYYGQNHGKNLMYRFDINGNGYLTKASKREKTTQKITAWFEYYPRTSYGKSHGQKIMYKFDLNSSGYVTRATKREQGTQRILVWYQYKPNTVYGKHGSQILGRTINVPLISQLPELPTGCEITAVTMMLKYKGANVDKIKLANEMPKHPWDPGYGYVGDPFTKRGWTIYPSALTKLVNKYAGNAENLTGKNNSAIENHLSANNPVVVWVSPMHGFSVHALVLTGFDQNYYYYNDPWTGEKNAKMTKSTFIKKWNAQSRRAISY